MDNSKNSAYWKETAKKQVDVKKSLTHSDAYLPILERNAIVRELSNDTTVLEVGCGACDNSHAYMQACSEYTGVELVSDFVKLGRSKIDDLGLDNATIFERDGLEYVENEELQQDVIITQRFIINLKDRDSQLDFFEAIKANGKPRQKVIICEGFLDPLARLNELRGRLAIPPVEVAQYNNFLDGRFVEDVKSRGFSLEKEVCFNAYFFVTRLFNADPEKQSIDLQKFAFDVEAEQLCDVLTDLSYSKIYVFRSLD